MVPFENKLYDDINNLKKTAASFSYIKIYACRCTLKKQKCCSETLQSVMSLCQTIYRIMLECSVVALKFWQH